MRNVLCLQTSTVLVQEDGMDAYRYVNLNDSEAMQVSACLVT